jgi:EAL domain-containing protein (putative c-di-GMP-specific phosphodiesterase class I)
MGRGPANFLLRLLQRVLDAPRAKDVKAVLFDPVTSLPTLPVLLPHIRKVLAQGKGLGILAVSIAQVSKLEEIYGWESFDEIVRGVAACLKATKDAALRKEDALAELTVNGNIFVLILGPPRSRRYISSRDLFALKHRVSKRLETYLGDTMSPELLRRFGYFIGAAVLKKDSAVRVERMVYRTIDEALAGAASEQEKTLRQRARQLKDVIEHKRIASLYQPILDVTTRRVIGYEAFSRGPKGNLESPGVLFQVASETELTWQLERVCRERALRGLSRLMRGQLLFINLEPASVLDPKLLAASFVRRCSRRVVFEITERAAIKNFPTFRQAVQLLKRAGFRVAVDDVGSAYAGLRVVSEIRPDFIKLDMHLTRGADSNLIKRQLIGAVAKFSRDAGVPLIVEGVETAEELATVRELGIQLAQGFFFGPLAATPQKPRVGAGGRGAVATRRGG